MTDVTLHPLGDRQSAGPSVVRYALGGRQYNMKTEPNCRVCMSPWRMEIEQAIVAGRTYRSIVESVYLQDATSEVRVSSVRTHFEGGHLPLHEEVTRAIIERRAKERGKAIEEGVDNIVTGLAVAEVVVHKGMDALARGELRPKMAEVLVAAKMLQDYDAAETGVDMDLLVEAFMIYHETAARLMKPEVFAAFGRELSANPVLNGLIARFEGEEHETVSSEVVAPGLDSKDA